MAIEFRLFPNGPLCIGAWDSGTVGSLEACIFEIIALNQKNILNLLTTFLRSVQRPLQIHKGPKSDIGTLTARSNVLKLFLSICLQSIVYRVYKKKLNRFEIALNSAKQLLLSSF